MPWNGVEPSRPLGHTPLKRARLPIPPPGQKYNLTKFSNHYFRWYRTISPQQLSGQTPSIPSAFEISILPVFFEAFFHIYTSVMKRKYQKQRLFDQGLEDRGFSIQKESRVRRLFCIFLRSVWRHLNWWSEVLVYELRIRMFYCSQPQLRKLLILKFPIANNPDFGHPSSILRHLLSLIYYQLTVYD